MNHIGGYVNYIPEMGFELCESFYHNKSRPLIFEMDSSDLVLMISPYLGFSLDPPSVYVCVFGVQF